MFFRKKPPVPIKQINPPPPWENIDAVPKRSVTRMVNDLTAFTSRATGLGRFGSKVLLLALAAGFVFVAYIVYLNSEAPQTSPPEMMRPAIDAYASSTPRR